MWLQHLPRRMRWLPLRTSHRWGIDYLGTPVTLTVGPAPASLTARTVTVTRALLRPGTTTDNAEVVPHFPRPTWYSYISDRAPPSFAGAAQDTLTNPRPGVALRLRTALGTVLGVTAALAADGDEVPAEFVAVTTNVYGVPFVRPTTVHDNPPEVEHD